MGSVSVLGRSLPISEGLKLIHRESFQLFCSYICRWGMAVLPVRVFHRLVTENIKTVLRCMEMKDAELIQEFVIFNYYYYLNCWTHFWQSCQKLPHMSFLSKSKHYLQCLDCCWVPFIGSEISILRKMFIFISSPLFQGLILFSTHVEEVKLQKANQTPPFIWSLESLKNYLRSKSQGGAWSLRNNDLRALNFYSVC